ncbi:DUF6924 domain-containing protein [Kineosporia succinea]|uniref:DUF6924 domain-containing protein n=1 Tax=Kineosporia succinea TaxID=84632 RepID=A0ABT9P9Y4_9ACTN|nr:hypothetical protein [Kineosporia succinea]MDP9829488.1 hypothetical protein [Kineosporia succinea]
MTSHEPAPARAEDLESRALSGVFSREMLGWKDDLSLRQQWPDPGRAPAPSREHQEDQAFLFRTDFSDDEAWAAMIDHIDRAWEDTGGTSVNLVDDPAHQDADPAALPGIGYYFVFDAHACRGEGFPLLVVSTDPEDDPSSFRATADSIPTLDANLSIGNVLFEELIDTTDDDGVYR